MSAWLLMNRPWLEPLLWGMAAGAWAPLAWWRVQAFRRDVVARWRTPP